MYIMQQNEVWMMESFSDTLAVATEADFTISFDIIFCKLIVSIYE